MSYLVGLGKRLARADFSQFTTLFFAILVVSFMFAWPDSPAQANNSWYSVVQLRLFLLAFLALGYGGSSSYKSRLEQRLTLGAILTLAVLSIPFEVAGYAASYPRASLVGSLALSLLDTVALFGLGLLCGYALSKLQIRFLLPLVVPAVLAGLIALDVVLGLELLPPFIFTTPSLTTLPFTHLAMMGAMSAFTLYLLLPLPTISDESRQA